MPTGFVPISGRSIGDSLVRDIDFGSPIARLELDCDTSCYLSPLCNLKKNNTEWIGN